MIFKIDRISFAAVFFLLFLAAGAFAADISLDVFTLDGASTIDFGTVKSLESDGSAPKGVYVKEVRLVVTSAQTRRYVLSQIVHSPPISSWGQLFDLTLMSCYATISQGDGQLRVAHPTPLSTGEQEIFLSSDRGGSAEIILYYRIEMPRGKEAGTYNTSITYKVSTL